MEDSDVGVAFRIEGVFSMNRCPAKCSGGNPTRQHPVSTSMKESFPENIRNIISKEKVSPIRCNYCGCVYINSFPQGRILGYWSNGVSGPGWT